MNRSFLFTRRVSLALLLSAVACVALLLLFPTSYGIYSANLTRDTPLTRLLPVALGALAASTVHSVAPSMEATAPTSLLRARLLSTTGVAATQIVLLGAIIAVLNPLAHLGITGHDVAMYLWATLFWQGLCCLCLSFSTSAKAWIVPLVVLLALLMYSWSDEYTPVPWNMLLTVNALTITMSLIAALTAGLALCWIDTQRVEPLSRKLQH